MAYEVALGFSVGKRSSAILMASSTFQLLAGVCALTRLQFCSKARTAVKATYWILFRDWL